MAVESRRSRQGIDHKLPEVDMKFSRRAFFQLAAAGLGTAALTAVALGQTHNQRKTIETPPAAVLPDASEILGFNPDEFNYKSTVLLPNTHGRYLLDIGQLHINQFGTLDITERQRVEKQQRNVESLLKAGKFPGVFVEGVTTELLQQLNQRLLLRNSLSQLPLDKNIWRSLSEENQRSRNNNQPYSVDSQFTNYIFLQQAARVHSSVSSAQKLYQFGPVAEGALQNLGFAKGITLRDIQSIEQEGIPYKPEAIDYTNAYAFLNAPLKMMADGEIEVFPAADPYLESELIAILSSRQRNLQLKSQARTPNELTVIDQELEELYRQFEDVNIIKKERRAVGMIFDNPATASMDLVPFVSGYGHVYKDEMLEFNTSNPGNEYGLIALDPRLDS